MIDVRAHRPRARGLAALALVALAAFWLGVAPAAAAPADDGFTPVPADAAPAPEALSSPLLVKVAYGLIWVAVCVYLGSLWRRGRRLAAEIEELRRRLDRHVSDRGGGSLPLAPPQTPPRSGGPSPPPLASRTSMSSLPAPILEPRRTATEAPR